jgi:hypothetical protein
MTAGGRRRFVRRKAAAASTSPPPPANRFVRAISSMSLLKPSSRLPGAVVAPAGGGGIAEGSDTTIASAAPAPSATETRAPSAASDPFVRPALSVNIVQADSAASSAAPDENAHVSGAETPPHHQPTADSAQQHIPPTAAPHVNVPRRSLSRSSSRVSSASASASVSKRKTAGTTCTLPLPTCLQRVLQCCFAPTTGPGLSFEAAQYLRFLQVNGIHLCCVFVCVCSLLALVHLPVLLCPCSSRFYGFFA